MPISFTVVVTVFERQDLLMPALFCVAHQAYPHWDLCVCADGPQPRALAIFRQYREGRPDLAGRMDYVTDPGAPGLWGNRTRRGALERARGDYTVFVGHDCVLLPGYLDAHVANIAGRPGCLSMVGVEFWKDRETYRPWERTPHPRYFGTWPHAGKPPDSLGPLDGVDLTALAFPTAAARGLGVFGPAAEQHYGADYLAYVACRAALPVVLSPAVVAGHF